MSKLHIHIHRARRAGKTTDAGFNEGDHRRDSDGKFAAYRTQRKVAGEAGQHALNLVSAAKTPQEKKAAAEASMTAHHAHVAAGKAFSDIPYPGNADYGAHHAERAAQHLKNAKALGAKSGKVGDAGEFDESKHKRDEGGKFSTTGAAGGDANHHGERAMFHHQQAKEKGHEHNDFPHHSRAFHEHMAAQQALASMPKAHPTKQGGIKLTAQEHANKAAVEEAKLAAREGVRNRSHGPTGFPSLGAGQGPGAAQPKEGRRYKPGDQIRQTMPVGSRVRLAGSAEEHEVVGHVGAGSNGLLQLKSGGTMPVSRAVVLGAKDANQDKSK